MYNVHRARCLQMRIIWCESTEYTIMRIVFTFEYKIIHTYVKNYYYVIVLEPCADSDLIFGTMWTKWCGNYYLEIVRTFSSSVTQSSEAFLDLARHRHRFTFSVYSCNHLRMWVLPLNFFTATTATITKHRLLAKAIVFMNWPIFNYEKHLWLIKNAAPTERIRNTACFRYIHTNTYIHTFASHQFYAFATMSLE